MALRALCLALIVLRMLTLGVAAQPKQASRSIATHPPLPTPTGTKPYCADASPTIPNGDFESGSLGPWGAKYGPHSNGSVTVVEGGYNSNYAAQMSGSMYFALAQYYLPNCEATNYTISFAYKVVEASPQCTIAVSNPREKDRPGGSVSIAAAASDWTEASLAFGEFTADTFGIEATIECIGNYEATVLFDDFAITQGPSLDPQDCPRPVSIPNGGFETNSLSPWKVDSPSLTPPIQSFVSPGFESDTAVQLAFPTVSDESEWQITAEVGSLCLAYDYNFTVAINWGNYTYPETIHDGGNGCFMTIYGASCTGKVPPLYEPPSQPNSGWQEVSFPCRPKSNEVTQLQFEVQCLVVNAEPVPPFTMQVDSFTVALA